MVGFGLSGKRFLPCWRRDRANAGEVILSQQSEGASCDVLSSRARLRVLIETQGSFIVSQLQTARIFVQEALRQEPGKILKLGDAYEFYADFCKGRYLPIIRKNGFKQPTVLAVRDTFNLGFRNGLKLEGKYAHGWKGLEVVAGASQTALAE